MNRCCDVAKVAQELKQSHLVSVFKKGDRKDPNYYRGLSITSSMSRLFGKILNSKLSDAMKDRIGEEQSGFVAGRSCVYNLFILQQLAEKKISTGGEIHMAFIDLEKAYDTIPQQKLWEALKSLEVDKQMLLVIQELYRHNTAYVKMGKQMSSKPIKTSTSTVQSISGGGVDCVEEKL
ncbi:uncharacterized protein LOC123310342 [Coccinella septempunctata]|uniref:uncharacterized protein LOC123310342 n=1 Tax=Coccinella septempunctata TaxID=41139 RepID=UPI001D094935|nr:uncharacterized protein LOC123310342 [Coccinella septempunctata]